MAIGKTTTEKNLSSAQEEKQKKVPLVDIPPEQPSPPLVGLDGEIVNPIPVFNRMSNERIIHNQNTNCMIRMGGDRAGSGTWGFGITEGAAAIDIVAGLSGKLARARDKDGFTVKTNPSIPLDAARIYISQRTNVDANFSLAHTKTPASYGASGIAIKADDVRIISRNTIKLITGTDSYDSNAKLNNETVGGIFLIAGNDDRDIQPLVKGDFLLKCLAHLFSEVEKELAIDMLELFQDIVDLWDFLLPPIGTGPIPGIPTIPNPVRIALGVAKVATIGLKGVHITNELLAWNIAEKNWLDPTGAEYILSSFNKTN